MSEQGFTISPWAFRDLTYMFSDPILVDQLLLTDEKQVAKYKKVNKDGSITLKKPYDNFNINSKNVCYPNNLGDNHLSLDNIEIVFEGFYKNKIIDNGNPDRDEKYVLKSVSIGIDRRIYHKSNSKTISSDYFAVLQIGDLLTEEQHSFVLSKRGGRVET